MKINLNTKLAGVAVGETKLEGIEIAIEVDYSLKEARGAVELVKSIVKDLPGVLEDLATAYTTIDRIDQELTPRTDLVDFDDEDLAAMEDMA